MQSLTQQFLTFCRSKPADEGYDYSRCDGCAFAQFLCESGYAKDPRTSMRGWYDASRETLEDCRPQPFDDSVLVVTPWTFSALADRLETALAEQAA